MDVQELREKHKLIDLFLKLCEIPSPPLKERAVSEEILRICRQRNISAEYDEFENIIARIPATDNFINSQSLLLSAHMDVVGGSEEVSPKLSKDGKYIETDKTRTLGADNKAGIAAILDLAIDITAPESQIEHGDIEITFTRDEEKGMTGIRNLDTANLKSKYAIIADGENLGELDCEGAGFTNVFVKVHGGKGGHSGINIHEADRINAIKVLSEFDSKIPQGVFKHDEEKGVITSINAGVCMGETANIYVLEMLKEVYELGKENKPLLEKYGSTNLMDTVNRDSMLNVIATKAEIAYSIRSSEPDNEKELLDLIKQAAQDLNDKYKSLIEIEADIKLHMQPFVKNEDDFLTQIIVKAGKKCGINSVPSSFHAGAETHILANEMKNADGEAFNPVIIGVADLVDIHSPNEQIDWQSFLKGRAWLEIIVSQFAEATAQRR